MLDGVGNGQMALAQTLPSNKLGLRRVGLGCQGVRFRHGFVQSFVLFEASELWAYGETFPSRCDFS